MNLLTVQLRFWEILHHLVNKEGMRVVHISEKGEEVWLEDDRTEPFQIIRIGYKDFDWSKELRHDISETYDKAKTIRGQLKLRSANVINVVLSPYAPVDSYEHLVDQALPLTAGGKQQQRTILLTLQNMNEKLFPLATEWKLKETPSFTFVNELIDIEGEIRALRYAVMQASENQVEKDRKVFFYGKPIVTFILLATILIMYAIVEYNGSSMSTETLISFGAKFNPLILQGEWWRFFSAMFLHIGFFHLMMNSLALFYLGSAVERIYGTGRFLIIYLIAGLVGSIASFALNEQVSAGASGAIFGCFGALLYFGIKHKRLFFRTMGMNVIVILSINLAFGFIVPMIDNGAHIGGLIGGFAASAIVSLPRNKNVKSQIIAIFVTIIAFLSLLSYGYNQPLTTQSYIVYYQIGREYIEENNLFEAKQYFEKIVEGNKEEAEPILDETYFSLGYLHARLGEVEEAKHYFHQFLENAPPGSDEAHYNLSLLYYQDGIYDSAYLHILKAIELKPDQSNYLELQEELANFIE
ncbi:rhomboid family intramembrane serine protease [Evansella cellulosilytica]|uniref:Rhomboid protease n=1 Tax=Evansella cellulosilytica (strain ATCC 21833 / DSM 2522 / FERM P-1141 / JCM 9156 / N-4) TaxID=649639 RepID=E6TWX2_EVAC2|nr:rhomboid family intramembrane serine protease [Evansella cellulosilytica]ADU29922.1 Rhomboid protease [Evansella cellulosilytica DSM 2522]